MKIQGIQKIEVEIEVTEKQLGRVILDKVAEMLGNIDDDCCDWYTCNGKVYIGDVDWFVSNDGNIASLVDAANILKYGDKMTFKHVFEIQGTEVDTRKYSDVHAVIDYIRDIAHFEVDGEKLAVDLNLLNIGEETKITEGMNVLRIG